MPEENFDDSLDINTIELSIRITFFNANRNFGLFFRKYYLLAWWEKAVSLLLFYGVKLPIRVSKPIARHPN